MTNPFYYALVWHGQGEKIIGQIIDLNEYQALIKWGHILHSFTGRKATVCVLSKDDSITRQHKLDFAIMFMKGAYVTITVDLKNLTSTTTNGNPPP